MYATLIVVAALWGAATGLLVPRAAYRFSVEPEDAWRDACPAGHALTGPGRGWLGSARCTACAAAGATAAVHTETGAPDTGKAPDAPDTGKAPDAPPATPRHRGGPRYAPALLAPPVSALGCAAVAATTGARPELAVWLLLVPVAVLLAAIDRRVHRLPDELTLPAAGAAAALLGVAALLPEHGGSWLSALLGGVGLGAFYLLLFLVNPNGMGFGDVKLALSLGVVLGWYGWAVVFAGGFAGFLFGAVYGLALMIMRRAGRRTGIPFGPFMIAGALLGVLLGGLAA
ncbi:A24 family peptidase [Streptomyces sp. ITFR-6]|uniref:A24 family peptidase n=1 Tax=Streptomyces sp. ITFR-6 TaxID=3075197 RepID=UPI002889F724|nr:A24 family peptidase [Streptomyces sp. ITFR-6]WNI29547.1 A24 family peptidase [Streptomyces sp. ITFR-6]